jgi:hypothetical protein
MSGIFISYRREDSARWTGRLSEHLREQFGPESIFMDIDTIQPGADFTEALQTAVSSCDVLLAIIGPEWATVTDKSGKPRLEDPTDWVRTEIATALKRKIRVIPVLVGGASVPTTYLLPDDLDALALRQAHELTDKRWSYDVEQLVKTLPAARQRPPTQLEATPTASSTGQFKWVVIGVLTVTLAISAWMMLKPGTPSAPPRDDVPHASPQGNPGSTPAQKPSAKPELDKPKPAVASHITHLHAGQEARFKENYPATFKVLATHVDRARPDTWSLSVTVRATGESAGTWLGSDNFRLLIDDVPQASTNLLGESVAAHSAKEGTLEFTFPVTAQRLVLQLRQGKEVFEFPLNLTPI